MSGDVELLAEVLSHALTDAEEWVKSAEVANLVDALLASDWLAAHDAEVAARVLREAADALAPRPLAETPCDHPEDCCGSAEHCEAMRLVHRGVGADWLRARADRVAGHTPQEQP